MSQIDDHPLRYQLSNELHARPFPDVAAPAFAAHVAVKQPQDAAGRDRAQDRAHLVELLDRFGAQHPTPEATHWFGQVGRYRLKWESHNRVRHPTRSSATAWPTGPSTRRFSRCFQPIG